MTQKKAFDILVLIARPAAGKSEIIDHLQKEPIHSRLDHFHLGALQVIDDFPMLWTWFEEDALLTNMGHPRLHTDMEGYFLRRYFWDLLIERINLDYTRRVRDLQRAGEPASFLIEFSRGTEHGGYRSAFQHLSTQILGRAAVLYVDVTWEESLRKNKKRFNPNKPDSILEHSLPDEKLERLYRETDWQEFCSKDPDFLYIQNIQVPYVVFNNMDDVTTQRGEALAARLKETLGRLWQSYQFLHTND